MTRFAVPIGLIAFCALAYWQTTQFDRVPPILLRGMQPADFPQMVLLLIVVLSMLLIVQAWLARGVEAEGGAPGADHEPMTGNVWKTMGLFLVFAALASVDLFLGLGVFAGCLAFLWGERRIVMLAVVTLVAPACVFFLFDEVFEVRFPRGLLTNLWYG